MSYLLKLSRIVCCVPLAFLNFNLVNANPITPFENSIPSVSKLSDITVNHWEFRALSSLVNRYDCLNKNWLTGEEKSLSRFEFALQLNQCLTYIQQRASHEIDEETLALIKRLYEEFSSEFISFNWKIEEFETRVSQLETQSYSTQVELEGEVIFALANAWGGNRADNPKEKIDDNLTFGNRVRLNLESSFTGKDRLQIRIQGRNVPEFEEATGTQMANLGFDGDDENLLELDELEYQFLLTESTEVVLFATGGGLGDMVPTVNPLFSGSGDGSISTFGRENPIRRLGGGSSVGITQEFGESVEFSLGYASNDSEDPQEGFLKNPYSAIAQLTVSANESIEFSLTYVYSNNNVDTGTGSSLAGEPFGDETNSVIADSFGAEVSFQLSSNLTLGGWVTLINANANDLENNPQADIMTWAMVLGITDLGKEGGFLGFVIGQPPKVIHNSLGNDFEDPDTSWHLEAFYLFPIADDIVITPGLFVITSPEHNNSNDTIFMGTIRTTFFF